MNLTETAKTIRFHNASDPAFMDYTLTESLIAPARVFLMAAASAADAEPAEEREAYLRRRIDYFEREAADAEAASLAAESAGIPDEHIDEVLVALEVRASVARRAAWAILTLAEMAYPTERMAW